MAPIVKEFVREGMLRGLEATRRIYRIEALRHAFTHGVLFPTHFDSEMTAMVAALSEARSGLLAMIIAAMQPLHDELETLLANYNWQEWA